MRAREEQLPKQNTVSFTRGARILSKGEQSDCAFMILSGTVRVFLEEGTREIALAVLGENEIFGEAAILGNGEIGAHVEATSDCHLQVITKDDLKTMLESADPIIQSLTRMLIKRLKTTNEALLKSETREYMDIVLI
jgi:CRP-like cAMP-binding protein